MTAIPETAPAAAATLPELLTRLRAASVKERRKTMSEDGKIHFMAHDTWHASDLGAQVCDAVEALSDTAPMPETDEIAAAYVAGWNGNLAEPRPFAAARAYSSKRYVEGRVQARAKADAVRMSALPTLKPLEWLGLRRGPGFDIEARPSEYARYIVRHLADGTFDVVLRTDTGSVWFGEAGAPALRSYDEATAFAEADYRKRAEAHAGPCADPAPPPDREQLARAIDPDAWSRYDTLVGFFEKNVGADEHQETYALMYRAGVRTPERAKAWLLADDTRVGWSLRDSLGIADRVIAAISGKERP